MNIYVGNLSWNLKDQDLSNLFASHGEVVSAKIVTDKFTNRSKGFGFVEMANDDQAQAAIAALVAAATKVAAVAAATKVKAAVAAVAVTTVIVVAAADTITIINQ